MIIVSETWIKSDDEAKRFQIPGYTHYHHYRQNTVGGGVSIFAHKSLNHHVIDELAQDGNHFLWIHLEKYSVDIGAIYKPGRTNAKKFLDTYSLQLHRRKRAIVFGDLNFDLLNPDSSVEDYKNTLQENGFTIVNKIDAKYCTRQTVRTKTLLDHVSTTLTENQFHLAVIESSMSDHKQIYFELKKFKPEPKKRINYEAIDYEKLYKISQTTSTDNNNDDYTKFEEKLLQTVELCRVKKTKIMNPPKQDWINKNILDKINRKNILWHRHKYNPEDKDKEMDFVKEKKLVSAAIKEMKNNYYHRKFSDCKNKPKKMWSLINSITQNKIKDIAIPVKLHKADLILTNGMDICEFFNEFFSTVGSNLAQAIPAKYHNDKIYTTAKVDCQQTNYGLTTLKSATTEEIIKIINNLDPNTSSGIDNINTKIIKCVKSSRIDELTRCINNCLDSGIFPSNLKIAKVSPIYKSGTKFDPSNYRPISVLPVISKIFEKVIYNRLEKYLNSINFLYDKQYGFRPKSNTLSATVDLVTKIKNNIDDKKIVLGIFIDLKKAFDTVSHDILLNKLEDVGITGNAHKIFKSYLTDRFQVVKIAEYQSLQKPITYGVPQGSILGPILFLIYVNNISKLKLKGELSLYADDTCLFYFADKIESIIQDAQDDLNMLNIWFQCNLLTLNVAKTHYVIFAAKNKTINEFEPLKINNVTISRSDSEKYLGLILDDQLTWKPHIGKLRSKLVSLTGALRSIVGCLPLKVRYTIYNSLVKPHIDYLIEVWGSAAKTNLDLIQTSQNRLIKTLFHFDYLTPTKKVYKKTKLLNIYHTYRYYTCILIRKILFKKIHTNITFNTKNEFVQLRRLRCSNDIVLRPPRTNYGKKNITYEGATLYNNLPNNIKEAKNMKIFKNLLRSHLANENEN